MERRKRKWISSWPQFVIALEVILHALISCGLICVFLFVDPFITMFSEYSAQDHIAIAKELFYLNAGKWPLFLGLLVFVGAISVIFSHQIVGPIYKLRHVLFDLAKGKLDLNIRFRKWDFLSELETPLNQVITQWKSDLSSIRQHEEQALELLHQMARGTPSKEQLKELENSLIEIQTTLSRYKGKSQ